MKHSLETQREYIALSNQEKSLGNMTKHELQIVRCETPDITLFFAVEEEMQRRGIIKRTMSQTFQDMTGGKVTG